MNAEYRLLLHKRMTNKTKNIVWELKRHEHTAGINAESSQFLQLTEHITARLSELQNASHRSFSFGHNVTTLQDANQRVARGASTLQSRDSLPHLPLAFLTFQTVRTIRRASEFKCKCIRNV
jgi:hypothetical protein